MSVENIDLFGKLCYNYDTKQNEFVTEGGAFMNIFRHIETTSYVSRNTFIKVYKNVAAS